MSAIGRFTANGGQFLIISKMSKYSVWQQHSPEAYAFFDNNKVEKYTYDESVVNGINVHARVYRISTNVTVHGGTINAEDTITEKSKKPGSWQSALRKKE